jgi:hypothetical protein
MDATALRLALSRVLKKYKIDDLALEADLTQTIRTLYGDIKTAPKEKEAILEDIAKAWQFGMSESDLRMSISSTIMSRLDLNPSGKDGQEFIEYAYLRSKHSEDIGTFIDWWLRNAGDPKYWSFGRMKTMWPQAFKKKSPRYVTPEKTIWDRTDYVPAPERKEPSEPNAT